MCKYRKWTHKSPNLSLNLAFKFIFIATWKLKQRRKKQQSIKSIHLIISSHFLRYSRLLIAWFMTVDLFAAVGRCAFFSAAACEYWEKKISTVRFYFWRVFALIFFSFRSLSNAKVHKPINQTPVLYFTVAWIFHTELLAASNCTQPHLKLQISKTKKNTNQK